MPGAARTAADGPRVPYEQRIALTLETIGIFRVVTRKALVAHCFDGHPFVANKALRQLEREGLVTTVPHRARQVRLPGVHAHRQGP